MWGNGFPAMRFCTVFPDRCESRAFFRPAARRRDGLLFSRGFCGLWDIWRGRPRGGGAPIPQGGSEADSISFDFAGSCHRLLFADGLPGVCNAQAGYSPAWGRGLTRLQLP